jgi:hypothetical protein
VVVAQKPARGASGGQRAAVQGSASLGTWLSTLNRLMKD